MANSIVQKQQQANASVGYGPNNPEPFSLRESKIPIDKDALHSATEYIYGKNTASTELNDKTEP